MTLTEIQREKGVRLDNMLKQDDFSRRDVDFWTEMENKRAQTRYLNSQSDKTDDDNVREWYGVVMDTFSEGLSIGSMFMGGSPGVGAGAAGFTGGIPKTRSFHNPTPPPRPPRPTPRGMPNRR